MLRPQFFVTQFLSNKCTGVTDAYIDGGPEGGVISGCVGSKVKITWNYVGCGTLVTMYQNGTPVSDVNSESGTAAGTYTISLDLGKFNGSSMKVCCLAFRSICSEVFQVIAEGNLKN